MNKSRPSPASSNECITNEMFCAYQLWCWWHAPSLCFGSSLNELDHHHVFLFNACFNTAWLSSSTVLVKKKKLGATWYYLSTYPQDENWWDIWITWYLLVLGNKCQILAMVNRIGIVILWLLLQFAAWDFVKCLLSLELSKKCLHYRDEKIGISAFVKRVPLNALISRPIISTSLQWYAC